MAATETALRRHSIREPAACSLPRNVCRRGSNRPVREWREVDVPRRTFGGEKTAAGNFQGKILAGWSLRF